MSANEQDREGDRNDQQPRNDGMNKGLAGPVTERPRLGRVCSAKRITPYQPELAGKKKSSEDDEDPRNTCPNPRIGPIHYSRIGPPSPFRKSSELGWPLAI